LSGFWEKYRARRRLGRQVSFWYQPRYDVPSLSKLAKSLGIVALRGKLALAQLAKRGLIKPGDLKRFPLASIKDLEAFHGKDYLERAGRPGTLAHIFGIPPEATDVDQILSAVRWAVSGTYQATRSVLKDEARLAINFGGGFHHAEPEMGSGFCVFNDVGIAIRKVREAGFRGKIAIVDLDFHQGNGNSAGFLHDPSVAIYSLHGAIWTDQAKAGDYNRNLSGAVGDANYLAALHESLPGFLKEHEPALLHFIAGDDVLERDMLGEFQLSLSGVRERDRYVLDLVDENNIPTVVTLAGGYSLRASQATLNLALLALGIEKELEIEDGVEAAPQFRRLMASIDPSDPQFSADASDWSEADLFPDWKPQLGANNGTPSAYEIERKMENSGVLEKYRGEGWSDFRVTLDLQDPEHRKVIVRARQGTPGAPLITVTGLT